MSAKIVRIVVWGAVAIAVVVVLYIRYTTSKVNRIISEANALIDEGNAKEKELGPEANQFFMGVVPKAFFVNGTAPKDSVLDRAKLEKSVAKTNEILTQVEESFRAAAAKFDEGTRGGKSGAVSKYLELMSQAYQKRADAEEAHLKAVALLLDKSIPQVELRKKCGELFIEARKLEGDFDRLEAEAAKLHGDNNKFN